MAASLMLCWFCLPHVLASPVRVSRDMAGGLLSSVIDLANFQVRRCCCCCCYCNQARIVLPGFFDNSAAAQPSNRRHRMAPLLNAPCRFII